MDFKKLFNSIMFLLGIIVFGTSGYIVTENMPPFEAFYLTIITISTVGFSEIHPLSTNGRIITILIISTGVAVGTYTIGMILRMFIEGELRKTFGRRKMERKISKLKKHFIVCGYGRIGRTICHDLAHDKIPFVVIEQDDSALSELEKMNFLFIKMDATSEEALLKAGIMEARGLVTAVREDANNVFIVLTAKGLRPEIFILSRSSNEKNEDKLKRAGASKVVSPYLIGGRRMAQILKRPTVVDFIDIATMGSKLGLMIEEAVVGTKSHLIGKNIIESNLRKDFGVIIVAIKKNTGEMRFNPLPSDRLESGDVIVVLGKREDLFEMNSVL